MNIVFFNTLNSKLTTEIEAFYLATHLITADRVSYTSKISNLLLIYKNLDNYSDEGIIKQYESILKHKSDRDDDIAFIKEILPQVKYTQKLKHKDKEDLILLGKFKLLIGKIRELVKLHIEEFNTKYGVLNLIPYVDNKILELNFRPNKEIGNNEDRIISEITETIVNHEVIISLSNLVKIIDHDKHKRSVIEWNFYFYEIPLWQNPAILRMTFEEHSYSREQIKPALQLFKTTLKKIQNDFFSIHFNSKNMLDIMLTMEEEISPLIMPIQNAIDESIFLSKLKNKFSENSGLRFNLGVTKAKTLINYYEKTKILEPYIVSEIKHRVSKHIDLNTCIVFCFFDRDKEK